MFIPDRAEFFVASRGKGSACTVVTFHREHLEALEAHHNAAESKAEYVEWGHVKHLPSVMQNPDNQHLQKAVQAISDNKHKLPQNAARNKYDREIRPGVWVDVYETCGAFMSTITDPLFLRVRTAVDHAVKKLLAPGERGHKELRQDLVEARDSINRAIEQVDEWV